jgi:hypothetical protein
MIKNYQYIKQKNLFIFDIGGNLIDKDDENKLETKDQDSE